MFKSVSSKKGRCEVPAAVSEQHSKCMKYNYKYESVEKDKIANNTTFYVQSDVAHAHQIKACFEDGVRQAKSLYGESFSCTVDVNLVKSQGTTYMGYAFVNLSNPILYYLLLGLNGDGSPQTCEEKLTEEEKERLSKIKSWADYMDELDSITESKRTPLVTLPPFKYDEEQKKHKGGAEYGNLILQRAFITPNKSEKIDEKKLFVTRVPAFDLNFLYTIFAPYAVSHYSGYPNKFYPIIEVKRDNKGEYYANIEYAHEYDAAFAFTMLFRTSVIYKGKSLELKVVRAFKKNFYK